MLGSSRAGDHQYFHKVMTNYKQSYVEQIQVDTDDALLENYEHNKERVDAGESRAQDPDYRLYQRLALQELRRRGVL